LRKGFELSATSLFLHEVRIVAIKALIISNLTIFSTAIIYLRNDWENITAKLEFSLKSFLLKTGF